MSPVPSFPISIAVHSAVVNYIKFHMNVFLEAGGVQDYYERRVRSTVLAGSDL